MKYAGPFAACLPTIIKILHAGASDVFCIGALVSVGLVEGSHCSVQHPVKASTAQIATETASVSKTAMALCPLEIVLERVVVTATGNVVACWQVAAGSDPSEVRR